LVLDEPTESDSIFEYEGTVYFADNGLMERTGDITIDYVEMGGRGGIMITSANIVPGCGSCSCQ